MRFTSQVCFYSGSTWLSLSPSLYRVCKIIVMHQSFSRETGRGIQSDIGLEDRDTYICQLKVARKDRI